MTEHAFARQIRPARPRLRTILGATVLAAGLSCAPVVLPAGSAFLSTSAQAADPMQITGTTVYDSTNSLGDTATLKSKISALSKKHNVDLHVVVIDKFENPSTSSSWTKALATKNNWGSADVVLVIATESRQAYFLAGSTKTLSSDQQTKVYQNYIKPKLQNSDYSGAALAAVEGIEAQKGGSSSGVVTGVLGVGAAATVGSALLQADTTMSHAKQELDFARAQYSDQQVAEFAQEIARAEDLMRKSFQRQQLLTDSIPDTEAEQRAWLTEIIDNSQEVTRIAQEQDAKLAQLRNLEQEAPQAIEALAQRLPQLRASVEEIAAQYRALKERYLPSALEPISKTPTLLESNMVLCAAEVEKAQATVATARSEAVAHLRTAEEAASQIQTLGAAVNTRSHELEQAQLGLSTDLLSIQRDVAEAKSLAASQRRDDLGAVAAGMEAVLNQVNQSASARPNDPLTLANQLRQLSAELDKAMTNMRATRERSRAASQNLDRTMRSAYAAVNGARSYINNRRAAVGPMTLTAVSEAERHLGQAQRLASSDPLNAMKEANMAIQKATDAQNRAQSEVGNYYNNQNDRGGGSFGGDLAKGLLLGALMTAMNSGTSSWGSSGGHSSGGSSGGSWGGGFSGGGGDWGSGGGDGGSF